jgi:hypothetical protein
VLLSWFFAGKILAFAPVDHDDPEGCDAVMAACHGLYVGVNLTANANEQFNAEETWTLPPGEKPDPDAGEQVLHAAQVLTARMLRWFWPRVAILVITGALLYLAATNASGTARVWTSPVAVAGGVGVSLTGLRAGAKKVAGGLEQDTWRSATDDAEAWSITWLPTLRQGPLARYRLRQLGVDPQAGTR